MKLLTDQTAARLQRLLASRDLPATRLVRRAASSAPAVPACQWRISARWDAEAGQAAVSVAPGIVAWGGGANATWTQTGDSVGSVPAGGKRLVVWSTTSPPRPLKYDPRWPDGDGAPACGCDDCDCHRAEGDPNGGWTADPGSIALVEESAADETQDAADETQNAADETQDAADETQDAADETQDATDETQDAAASGAATDMRLVGVVEVSDSGRVTVTQWQRDTIVVRAIVGARPGKAEDPDDAAEDEPPPCGNPMNEDGGAGVEANPLNEDGGTGGTGGSGDADDHDRDPTPPGGTDDNPLDKPGDGGYTPACRDETGNENDY